MFPGQGEEKGFGSIWKLYVFCLDDAKGWRANAVIALEGEII